MPESTDQTKTQNQNQNDPLATEEAGLGIKEEKQHYHTANDGYGRVPFTTWLLTQQDRPDIVGHFAMEVAYDTTWPADDSSRHRLHLYLNGEYAMDVVHQALDAAWFEWRTLVGEGWSK